MSQKKCLTKITKRTASARETKRAKEANGLELMKAKAELEEMSLEEIERIRRKLEAKLNKIEIRGLAAL